jgi:anaerobic selenocysteine-containing dehydrogenase
MMAWPDQRRTEEALDNLDLLVTTDVWYSPTARVADYVCATKMTFETPGMTQVTEGIKYHNIAYGFSEPYAQYTPALLDPPADSDLIEDWQLFYRVGKRLGLSMSWLSVFGSPLGHMEAPLEPVPPTWSASPRPTSSSRSCARLERRARRGQAPSSRSCSKRPATARRARRRLTRA